MTSPTKVRNSTADLTAANANWTNALSIAGVVGDGVTDCSAGLVAFLAAATAGTVLYFPAGTYLVATSTLTPAANNVVFRGAGPNASILKNTSFATFGQPLLSTGGKTGIEVYDLGFNYTGAVAAPGLGSSTCLAVKVDCPSKFRFKNCRITITNRVSTALGVQSWFAPKSGGAALTDYVVEGNTITAGDVCLDVNQITSDGIVCNNNFNLSAAGPNFVAQFALCTDFAYYGNSSQSGIVFSGVTNSRITNNDITVTQAPASAINGTITITSEVATASTKNTLSNNTVRAGTSGNYTAIVYLDTNCINNTVASNTLNGTNHVFDGITIVAGNNTIQGNQITGNVLNGITCTAGNFNSYVGNYIQGCQNSGIKHTGNTPVQIVGNTILDANQSNIAGAANGAAINLTTQTVGATVVGNHLKYTPAGPNIKPAYGIFGSALTAASIVCANNCVDSQTANYTLAAAVVTGANV